ncbi:MAG: transposase [Bacteroidota bacterium]|nr:transposase [Bacteroidia bacterium]
MFAFCIMPSHIHLIAKTEDDVSLSNVLRNFKSYTSKQIIKMIEESHTESRREWLLYMFEFYGKKMRTMLNISFGNRIIMPSIYSVINLLIKK